MQLPRDVSGAKFSRKLASLGYAVVRQKGSHLTIRTEVNGRHTIQIPLHKAIRVGTLYELLKVIAAHHSLTIEELATKLELT